MGMLPSFLLKNGLNISNREEHLLTTKRETTAGELIGGQRRKFSEHTTNGNSRGNWIYCILYGNARLDSEAGRAADGRSGSEIRRIYLEISEAKVMKINFK